MRAKTFVHVALAVLLFAQAAPADAPQPVHRRILVFGIDGGTWTVIDPLLAKGRMPHLKKLIDAGAKAHLKTIKPTISPLIWTTIATGVPASVHGITDFTVKVSGTKKLTLPSSNMRRARALWNILSINGYKVGVTGWWVSFPAERVQGFVISDRANKIRKSNMRVFLKVSENDALRNRSTFPPELMGELSEKVTVSEKESLKNARRLAKLSPEEDRKIEASEEFSRSDKLSVLKFSLLDDDTSIAYGLYAMKKFKPDVMFMYLTGIDNLEHHFWKYFQPNVYQHPPSSAELAKFGDVISNYYVRMDEVLGQFLTAEGAEDLTVMVVSDHGHEANLVHSTSKARGYWTRASGYHEHAPDGILVLSGKDIVHKASIDASVFDVAPTILALMGVPLDPQMTGHPLTDAINPAFLAKHPVERLEKLPPAATSDQNPVPSEQDPGIIERLKSLGYMN